LILFLRAAGVLAWLAAGALAAPGFEVWARLVVPPGNITVTPEGRVIVSLHQFFEPQNRVIEIRPDGSFVPFPNAAWNLASSSITAFDSVLGLQSDPNGVVWLLDNGLRGGTTPKLVAWDTRKDRLARIIHLPRPAIAEDSFLNDLVVDAHRRAIYITDPAGGEDAALIVVNLDTGLARRVLEGHNSVVPENVDLAIDEEPVGLPHVGANPIALDAPRGLVYFGPMSSTSLYRISADDLCNESLSDSDLAARVERFSDKPICDGIIADPAGNIYVTDLAANAVGVINPKGAYRLLFRDPALSWPDAFAFGPDGLLYVVANQLHRSPRVNQGENLATTPFCIFRGRPGLPTPRNAPQGVR
jgi:sugar lactone lactonase YvrE